MIYPRSHRLLQQSAEGSNMTLPWRSASGSSRTNRPPTSPRAWLSGIFGRRRFFALEIEQEVHRVTSRGVSHWRSRSRSAPRSGDASRNSAKVPLRMVLRVHSSAETITALGLPLRVMVWGQPGHDQPPRRVGPWRPRESKCRQEAVRIVPCRHLSCQISDDQCDDHDYIISKGVRTMGVTFQKAP